MKALICSLDLILMIIATFNNLFSCQKAANSDAEPLDGRVYENLRLIASILIESKL